MKARIVVFTLDMKWCSNHYFDDGPSSSHASLSVLHAIVCRHLWPVGYCHDTGWLTRHQVPQRYVCLLGGLSQILLQAWVNKLSYHLKTTDICSLCGLEREDEFHAMCKCPHAVELWRAMTKDWMLRDIKPVPHTCPDGSLPWLSCSQAHLAWHS